MPTQSFPRFAQLVLLTLVGLFLSGCGGSGAALGEAGKTNVVLIIMDTLRADAMSCYGCPVELSPELDAIAAAGVRFDRVLAQCSWTRPSIGYLK